MATNSVVHLYAQLTHDNLLIQSGWMTVLSCAYKWGYLVVRLMENEAFGQLGSLPASRAISIKYFVADKDRRGGPSMKSPGKKYPPGKMIRISWRSKC